MKSMLRLGQQLRTLRIKNGYTQQEISDLLGLERSTYAYYETNRTTPPLNTLKKLADIFNISVSDFLEHDEALPQVSDPESLTFTEFDHNLSHIYELRPEERRLVALFRLGDQHIKRRILNELESGIRHTNHKTTGKI